MGYSNIKTRAGAQKQDFDNFECMKTFFRGGKLWILLIIEKKLGIGFCDEEKIKYLKVKIFNILNGIEKGSYSGCIDNEEYKTFCNTIGLQIKASSSGSIF